MKTYIGIDLGTSSIKAILIDKNGTILNVVSKDYPVFNPKENYSEQDPNDWYFKSLEAIKELLSNQDSKSVEAISFAGQMHGLVLLDNNDSIIRNAILWNDGRAFKETEYLNQIIGQKVLSKETGNIAFAGFMAPKILWVYNNERENFDRIDKIMLPKDYLIYKYTGIFATDVSDASGMLLLDVKERKYSQKMLEICHIKEKMLPKLFESYQKVGTLKQEIAKKLSLKDSVIIAAGAGDNAAAAIGTNTIEDGTCNISLGTSGTIFLPSSRFIVDKNNSLHSFCDSSGKYHLMGCILSAANCRKWWLEQIIQSNDYLKDEQELVDSEVIFLPYLNGERSPHNDVNAKGAFINLKTTTSTGAMSKAILEGVCFALKDCLTIVKQNGLEPIKSTICGGGSSSEAWCQMMADVLEIPISKLETNQGPSYGAAILALVASNEYDNVLQVANKIVKITKTYYPHQERFEYYRNKYQKFRKLYPLLKKLEL